MSELVKVTQKPVIDFSKVVEFGNKVDERLSVYNFDDLLVDEETVKGFKTLRAELNKELKSFDDSRKEIKKLVNDPYTEFEKVFNDNIKDKYNNAIRKLKTEIDIVEDKLKQAKEDEVKLYFEENNVNNWLTFEQLGIKVGLSSTVKKLCEEVDTFLDNVSNDIKIIETQENKDRIIVRYQSTLNLSQSIIDVGEEVEKENKLSEVVIETVEEVETEPEVTEEKESMMLFLKCTQSELQQLKQFMNDNKIEYEL